MVETPCLCLKKGNFPNDTWTYLGVRPWPLSLQDAEFENAVIGGTGMFRGASGSLNVTTLEEGSRWRYDIYLMQKPNCTTS